MVKFVGCKKAKEVSLTKDPANERAVMLMAKTRDAPQDHQPQDQSETDAMELNVMKSLLAMSEVTKAHALGLDDEALKTFMAKSPAEQQAEAEAAKKAKDDAAAETARQEEARKAAEGATDEATKANTSKIAELEKTLASERQEREIEKMVGHADFHGYPGGTEKLTEVLKTAFSLPDAAKAQMIEMAKNTAAIAKKAGSTEFGAPIERDISKSAPVTHKLTEIAKARAKEAGSTWQVELAKMGQEPEYRAEHQQMLEENDAAA